MTDAHFRPAVAIRIGRQPDNDIALTGDLEVSRHHAGLRRNPAGSFELIDLVAAFALITDFWPQPYELPARRAHLVERY